MSGRAPEAIRRLWDDVEKAIPKAKLSGILGDAAHFAGGGYHVPRRSCPPSDYSVTRPRDRKGASDCASALDITLPPDLMQTLTRRLLNAAREHDPRLYALREFCGTLNGHDTYPWDLATNSSEGVGSWDDSHLWHIHLSFWRDSADNYAALAPIADVLAGIPLVKEFTVNAADEAKIAAIVRKVVREEGNKGFNVNYLKAWTGKFQSVESFMAGAKAGYTSIGQRAVDAAKKKAAKR